MTKEETIDELAANSSPVFRAIITLALLSGIGSSGMALVGKQDVYTASQARSDFALIHERLDRIRSDADKAEKRIEAVANGSAPVSVAAKVMQIEDAIHKLELEMERDKRR